MSLRIDITPLRESSDLRLLMLGDFVTAIGTAQYPRKAAGEEEGAARRPVGITMFAFPELAAFDAERDQVAAVPEPAMA